jgi:orotidine-5'-phosphate decarboxylase
MTSQLTVADRLWFPVDVSSLEDAKRLYGPLAEFVPNAKVGLELITAVGAPAAIECVKSLGAKRVWYDGKFDDIPNTIAGASRAVVRHGVDIFNMHSCGFEAITKAVENKGMSKLLVVTILTSLGPQDVAHLAGFQVSTQNDINVLVHLRAQVAALAGADGIVCSPQELRYLSRYFELSTLERYTPGIRDADAPVDDQWRTMTAFEAIKAGATALVVGRPISDQKTRGNKTAKQAVEQIYEHISAGLAARDTN